MRTRLVVLLAVALSGRVGASADRRAFLNGIDAGYLPYLASAKYDSPEWADRVWRKPKPAQAWFDGKAKIPDLAGWFARQGVNAVRLRIWTDAHGPYSPEFALAQARIARRSGQDVFPVLFLSDRWADLGKQPRPAAWAGYDHDRLVAAVREHAVSVASLFRDAGIPVALWGVGNEADFGVCGMFPAKGIANVPGDELARVRAGEAELLAAAIAGVRSVDPAARVAVHLGMSWDEAFVTGWLGFMAAHGVAFDAIGLTYYPSFGPMQVYRDLVPFDALIDRLHAAFGKPVVIPEYAFPHAADCSKSMFPDFCHPVWGKPPTPATQSMQVARFLAWALTKPSVLGAFYWSPEWYAPGAAGAPEPGWGPLAVFDVAGRTLPASRAFAIGRTRHGPAAPASVPVKPACGVKGYELAADFTFGTTGTVRTLEDLDRLFTHDAPWGRINDELQKFEPFNPQNHVIEPGCLALTGRHDGSTNYTDFGHITSGALLSRLVVGPPCIVEFVVKQPAGRGCWPSLWLYDTHSGKHDASEIDVLESQNNPPKLDRSMVFQFDHGPGVGAVLRDPGKLGTAGFWRPYGPMPGGDLSARYVAYSVHWLPDRVVKYVDGREALTRAFTWTGPEPANLLVYLSIGSAKLDWPGPVLPETFTGDHAVFRIRSIRVFKPAR